MIELEEGQIWESTITGERRKITIYECWLKDVGGDEVTFTSNKTQRAQIFKYGRLSRKVNSIEPGKPKVICRRLFISWIRRTKARIVV